MSNLYNLEPQPTAKVVLNTSSGDLTFELFAKQTPLASRNFLQHCIDGYYNNTIFHRLVPGFIIQGGDPTGTGHGGISAVNNGEPFQDEFHSRLKFNRRGLLGMANEGKDNNASQFFLTLDATPELQGKHTMFGRIEGDTIYNLMKMADAEMSEVEGSDRPLFPTKIVGAEVLVNPFEDMVARAREAPRTGVERKIDIKKRKKPAGKNVLSFGADEGEQDAAPVLKKTKANPKLVAADPKEREGIPEPTKEQQTERETRTKAQRPEVAVALPNPSKDQHAMVDGGEEIMGEESGSEAESELEDVKRRRKLLDRTNAEIAALKASMKRTLEEGPKEKERPKSALEAMIPATSTRGRKRGKITDEKGAIDLFQAFKSKLEDLSPQEEEEPAKLNGVTSVHKSSDGHDAEPNANEPGDEEARLCDLHFIVDCQSCRSWDQDKPDGDHSAEGEDDAGWMSHILSFAKDTKGKDLEFKKKMAEIEVIDPREKAKAIEEQLRNVKKKAKR